MIARPGETADVEALAGAQLRRLALESAVGPGEPIPSRLRILSRSTSNSAKVAKLLKNILPIGSLGS
jgi:hypothetical protein